MVDAATVVRIWMRAIFAHAPLAMISTGPKRIALISMNVYSLMVDAATVVRIWMRAIFAHVPLAIISTGPKRIALPDLQVHSYPPRKFRQLVDDALPVAKLREHSSISK